MAEAHPVELRIRVVRAYEEGVGSYPEVAARFAVGEASVKRWVQLHRRAGGVAPTPKGGGTPSMIRLADLEAALAKIRDATAGELTAEFNRGRARRDRVHVSSIKRALRRHGYVVKKKRRRPLESLRPDVVVKRASFLKRIRRVPIDRLVFLDESGMNVSMSRSHAWVKRGEELVDRIPMNWGKNLTLLGAIRLTGWVVLTSMFATANKDRFVAWVKAKLLPKLRRGDVVVMDNLRAHHDPRVRKACAARGVRVIYLPPYSPDFNPIESGWALQKQYVRRIAPRTPDLLRRVARRARHRVTPRHCRNWFAHCGYPAQRR